MELLEWKPPLDPAAHLYAEVAKDQVKAVRGYRRPPTRFRASEAADCARKIWYRLSGYIPAPRTAFLELVSQSGNMHHDYVRHLLHLYGVPMSGLQFNADGTVTEDTTIVREFEYDGVRFSVSGRSDGGVVVALADGTLTDAVLEIKSIGAWRYRYINEAFTKGPQELYDYIHKNCRSYVYQGTTMALLQDKEYIYLLLVGRDMLDVGLFNADTGARHGGLTWRVDEDLQQRLLRKFARIQRAVDDNKPPPPEYAEGSKECKQCDFLLYCHQARSRRERGIKPYVLYPVPGVFEEAPE